MTRNKPKSRNSRSGIHGKPDAFVHTVATSFTYAPLDFPSEEIRLVRLHAARSYEPINCTIFHATLSDNDTKYSALSYVWGDQNDKLAISVNGCSFRVTRSLKTALQYIRKPDEDLTIWIDALCINQEENAEKSVQVARMQEIYRNAEDVKIWLGPAADDSDRIMDAFRIEGEKLYAGVDEGLVDEVVGIADMDADTFWKWFGRRRQGMKIPEPDMLKITHARLAKLRDYLMAEDENRTRRSLEALLKRDYWTRIWVVQEIFVAKRLTLQCGLFSVSWRHAMAIVMTFRGIRNAHLENRLLIIEARLPGERRSKHMVSESTREMSDFELMTPVSLALLRSREKGARRDATWLLDYLVKLRHFKSTDSRDKIFGLLGLLSQPFPDTLRVNYELTFLEVSLAFFKLCTTANQREGLDILSASQPTAALKLAQFPSWLPDFSRFNGMEPWPRGEYDLLPSDQGPSSAHFDGNDRVLHVQGVCLATLRGNQVTEGDDALAVDEFGLLMRIERSLEIFAKTQHRAGDHATSMFWETLILGNDSKIGASFPLLKSPKNSAKKPRRRRQKRRQVMALKDGHQDGSGLPVSSTERKSTTADDSRESMIKEALERLDQRIFQKPNNGIVKTYMDHLRVKAYRRRFAVFDILGRPGSDYIYNIHSGLLNLKMPFPAPKRTACFAMVPDAALPGDRLFMLAGCRYHVLLRPRRELGHRAYEFVGPCCIPELVTEHSGPNGDLAWIAAPSPTQDIKLY